MTELIRLLLTAYDSQQKEKKKVGRPIAYKGDPNAPELTEQERRRIKRRIANRESARRVRNKRQEILEEMQGKVSGPCLPSFLLLFWLLTSFSLTLLYVLLPSF